MTKIDAEPVDVPKLPLLFADFLKMRSYLLRDYKSVISDSDFSTITSKKMFSKHDNRTSMEDIILSGRRHP